MDLKRTDVLIKPNNARVLVRPFEFADSQRAFRIVARVMSLTDDEVDRLVGELFTEFHGRHQKARQFILHRFEYARQYLLTDAPVSENRQLLIGGLFHAGVCARIGGPVQSRRWFGTRIKRICRPARSDLLSACGRRAKDTYRRSRFVPASSTAIARSCSIPRRDS